ncbi:MAG: CDP-alcohol phosphatidyltransferase family protein [Rhodanobacteraceae bacterium]|nr:CDP-alcohol phosphatidyltransferase family protein [Rhodanobacteraceae bacterium]
MSVSSQTWLRHLPNTLSLARLVAALPIAWLVVDDHAQLAMVCFIIAGASDGLDGWLAKRFGWQSQLGGWLDPLADKALVLAVCVALALHGDLPWWLLALIAVRDVVIVSGAVAFHFSYAPLYARPTWLGKLTTFALLLTVVALLARNVGAQIVPAVVDALVWLCAGLLVASGIDYVRRWSHKARELRRTEQSQTREPPGP